MWIKYFIVCVLISYTGVNISAQTWVEWEEQVADEQDIVYWQERYEEMSELIEHPFNINTITKEQLEQLPFLSDKLIENILYYLYKYGPMVSKKELLGIEGMDWQTRRLLEKCVYVGEAEDEKSKLRWRNIWKYNKQELFTRVDIPLNKKAGYADYDPEILEKSPNKRYYGDPIYNNIRYRFRYRQQLFAGLTAEKDAGEPFFRLFNKKGYDFYSGYLFLQDVKRWKAIALGHYRVSFGYGLVINQAFSMGKSASLYIMNRMGRGLSKYTSVGEYNYLQGAGATYRLSERWNISAFYSFRKQDANVENMFITSLKTDGYHRLRKDVEKMNTVSNHLAGSNLSYNGKHVEFGLTAVYNIFDKVLNPDYRKYNRYYPRGKDFFNAGVNYKFFFRRMVFSGETAVDRQGKIATINMLSYSPTVNTTFLLMNRYFDKRYQALYANAFGENSRIQNEAGIYIGLETKLLNKIRLLYYTDFFYFPYYRYRVDKEKTMGIEERIQISYSPINSLSMLIKYSYKNKAQNYTSSQKTKFVLPYMRHRLHYQLSYSLNEQTVFKTMAEYIRTSYYKREYSNGLMIGGSAKVGFTGFPFRASVSGAWFRTDDYNSHIYMYEPGLLYAFSMNSFYGKGTRLAVNLRYDCNNWLMIQGKWGWTHYTDRNRISSGPEEIMGNNKADLQFQLRIKF